MRAGRDRDTGYHRRSVDSDCRRLPLRGAGRRALTCWKYAGIALWERARLSSEMRWIRFPLPAPMDRWTSGEVTTLSRWRGWVRIPHGLPIHCGHSSVGRARSFHVRCREFEPRCPLHIRRRSSALVEHRTENPGRASSNLAGGTSIMWHLNRGRQPADGSGTRATADRKLSA